MEIRVGDNDHMDARVELITRVIAERKSGQLSAREAGPLVGLSESHFLRLFKREAGTTFRRFKREVRISIAASLLADYANSVKQIASATGYEDQSNFHRDFKRVRGMSPRQWKLTELRRKIAIDEASSPSSAPRQSSTPAASAHPQSAPAA
jgi:AraC-like DNA-binding protein